MKKHPQNKVEEKVNNVDEQKNENELKSKGFFKTIWYSIDKIEKYPELAAEGFIKAIRYLVKLIAILAIIISAVSVYKSSAEFKEIAQYIDEKAPNFTYKDNVLTSEEAEDVIRNESEEFGKVIIDLKVTDENQIEAYVNEIGNEESGMVILNNQLIIKQGTQGNIRYSYEDLLKQMGVTEFNKQQLVDYLSGTAMMNIYLGLFVSLFIYSFVIYFINTLINVLALALFGYLATFIMKMKMRFVAIFNMAIYSITLATLLNIIYAIINGIFNYQIRYFDIMYTMVSAIYMVAAIFMLKADFNKKQGEVQKIVEVEKTIKKDTENSEQQENNDNEKKEEKKEENNQNKDTGKDKKEEKKNKKESKKDLDGEEPAGSNA